MPSQTGAAPEQQQDGDLNTLSASVQKKFEQAKRVYAEKELKRLGEENAALSKEVEEMRIQLGGEPSVNQPAIHNTNSTPTSTPSGMQEATPQPPQQQPQQEKPAKAPKSKPEKKQAPAAEEAEIDIGRLDLRVGRILEAKKHPDADSLYVSTIDLGEDKPRTVVSGLVRFVPLEEMQNRLVVCLCNLKPAKMRGVESQAMVMCGSTAEKVEIMEVNASCQPGDRIECSPYVARPDALLNPKKKVWETVAVDLQVSDSGEATYKGAVLKVKGQHPMTAKTLRNVPVK